MKVKMLTMMSGPLECRYTGHEYDIADAEAARLLAAGFAERVDEPEAAAMRAPVRRTRARKIEKA